MGFIYLITNKINNHVYIGQTKRNIEQRWKEHLRYCELNNGQIKQILKIDIGKLCNYKDMNFEDLIDEIVIGPRSLQSEKELKLFLKEIDLEKLVNKVKLSKCPLR